MSKDKLDRISHDLADSVSVDSTSSKKFLESKSIDFNSFVNRGLKDLENLRKKKKKLTKSQTFFRRVVLAAEIVYKCHNHRTFGRVKFQKLLFLCEQVPQMELSTNYTKQAAGPFDNKFMHSIGKEFKKQKWFDVKKVHENGYSKVNYTPLENVENYKKYYNNYFLDIDEKIQFLIKLFFYSKTREIELVATIYACWQEAISNKMILSESLIINLVYDWAKEKKKFSEEEIITKISWMKEKGVYPVKHLC